MDHELACLADPLHFRPVTEWAPSWSRPLRADGVAEDPTWRSATDGPWVGHRPVEVDLPDQGWKIHVSATTATAELVVQVTAQHCERHRIPFKHLATTAMVVAAGLRSAPRSGAGKALTVYPADEAAAVRCADTLADLLAGVTGPYVLSDRQWRPDAPVFVRYGAFRPRQAWLDDGRRAPGRVAGSGRIVEDSRRVPFELPEDVEVGPALGAVLSVEPLPADFPVEIDRVIRHTTSGGIYRGRWRADGRRVVVKEARPLTGGSPRLPDAASRQENEAAVLSRLRGRGGPAVVGRFELDGHTFLACAELPGQSAQHWVATHHPAIRPGCTPAEFAAYARDCARVSDGLATELHRIHAAGLAHNDVHPGNVLVDDDLTVHLVDFELGGPAHARQEPLMRCGGFARAGGTGADRDLFGASMVSAWLLHPGIGPRLELLPDGGEHLADEADTWFGPQAAPVRRAVRAYRSTGERLPVLERTGRVVTSPSGPIDRDAVARYLLSEVDLAGGPMLPADPAAYAEPLAAVAPAHGVGGALLALVDAGFQVPDAVRTGFARAAATALGPVGSPGLWDGWAGVAVTAEALGDPATVELALDGVQQVVRGCTDPSLGGGLAGVAVAQLHLAGRTGSHRPAERAAVHLDRLAEDPDLWIRRCRRGGLLGGPTGVAAALLRGASLLERPEWLPAAAVYLATDLDRCVPVSGTALALADGPKMLPYLGDGSLGVALVLREFVLAGARPDPRADRVLISRLASAGCVPLVAEPGLRGGRAGLALGLSLLARDSARPEPGAWAARHVRALAADVVQVDDGSALLGRGGSRASTDLATGAAGLLLAMTAGSAASLLLGLAPATEPLNGARPGRGVSTAHRYDLIDTVERG